MLCKMQDEDPASNAALEVLEEIDDDLDELGIIFVKLDDEVTIIFLSKLFI